MSTVDTELPDSPSDEIILGVLDVVERNPAITQRSVASELGIAVGLANAYVKRCVRKGLIKVSQVPRRRYVYYLTPQGFTEKSRLTASFLVHSFSFFRRARSQCADTLREVLAHGQSHIALIGTGELADIAGLVAREVGVEIVGVVEADTDSAHLIKSIATFGKIDAVVITAMVTPREVFDAAVAAFGPERVHVPLLMRVNPQPRELPSGDDAS